MTVRITILGCGSSGGVPRVGGEWGVCDPKNPKNRRSRCSILVEKWDGDVVPPIKERTCLIVDTSPDLREQFLRADVQKLDAVFYTHDHADQSHGIDDLRAIAYRMRKQIPTYMDAPTKEHVYERFKYCFEMPEGRVHPPILELQDVIKDGDMIEVSGSGGTLSIDVVELSHGPTPSLGFVFEKTAFYAPDVWDIPEAAFERLDQLDVWIVDALRYNQHPTHAHADRSLTWLARSQARKGVLTNLHIDMDYDVLSAELPGRIEPAYDGLEIILDI